MGRSDADLYERGVATLVASWEEYSRGSPGAALERLDGVSAAVFPAEPERSVYNNALLARHLTAAARSRAVDAMEAVYGSAGVDAFAAWVHESDEAMGEELTARGYEVVESTRAMGLALEDPPPVGAPTIELGAPDWTEYLRILEVPSDLLAGADPAAFHVLIAADEGENVAAGMAYDHDGDCGVFNVVTVERARRRGLGSALTARLLHDAVERGCSTASLQSTPIAERVYAAVGFRDLGRILEYAR